MVYAAKAPAHPTWIMGHHVNAKNSSACDGQGEKEESECITEKIKSITVSPGRPVCENKRKPNMMKFYSGHMRLFNDWQLAQKAEVFSHVDPISRSS
jgi:hypothetical protein